ncbi:MAG: AAA family ATPase [Gammaproteobacteria bacterium]|nr:AAA family ATPase [Gammaproteobacteria bacterium]
MNLSAQALIGEKVYKIAILGSPGSGKTTLAKILSAECHLPLIHLDKNFLRSNWQAMPEDEWILKIKELVKQDSWIMDGNYFNSLDIRLNAADVVIFLDIPRITCLWRITKRALLAKHAAPRTDLPSGCIEKIDRNFFNFFKFVWEYHSKQKPLIKLKLESLKTNKTIVVLHNNREIENLINSTRNS